MHPIILCVFVFIFYNSASASVISRLNQIIFDFQIPWDLIFPISRQTKWHAKLNARNKISVVNALAGVNLAQLSTSWPSCWNSCYLRNGPTQRAAPYQGPWDLMVTTLPRIDWQLVHTLTTSKARSTQWLPFPMALHIPLHALLKAPELEAKTFTNVCSVFSKTSVPISNFHTATKQRS